MKNILNKNERCRDVKTQKHPDKVGIVITQEVKVGPKIKQTAPYNPT